MKLWLKIALIVVVFAVMVFISQHLNRMKYLREQANKPAPGSELIQYDPHDPPGHPAYKPATNPSGTQPVVP